MPWKPKQVPCIVHVGYASPQIYWQLCGAYGAYGAWIFRLYTGYPLFPGENEVGAKDVYPGRRVVLCQSDPHQTCLLSQVEQLACIMEIFGASGTAILVMPIHLK